MRIRCDLFAKREHNPSFIEMREINDPGQFKDFLAKNPRVLVDFYATWCGPCKMLAPVLENAQRDANYEIVKVNVDSAESLVQQYGVTSMPTLVWVKDNSVVHKQNGFMNAEQLAQTNQRFFAA